MRFFDATRIAYAKDAMPAIITTNLINPLFIISYFQLPYHANMSNEKFRVILSSFFDGKEVKRTVDYRLALVRLIHWNKKHQALSFQLHEALETLCEVVHILYLPEEKRTVQGVLRLNNQCFKLRLTLLNR